MSKVEFLKRAGLSSTTFTKLRNNEEVMQCDACDMMDFIPDYIPAVADDGVMRAKAHNGFYFPDIHLSGSVGRI